MMYRSIGLSSGLFILISSMGVGAQPCPPVNPEPCPAGSQHCVEGRAFGTCLTLLGSELTSVRTADTSVRSATAPNGFSEATSSAALSVPGVAEVASSASETSGNADPNTQGNTSSVMSAAGDAVVAVVPATDTSPEDPAGAAVLEVATSTTTATVSCTAAPTGTAHIDVLSIAGTPVSIPGDLSPNTTILSPALPLLILNEQIVGETSITVNAVHAKVLTNAELVELIVSSASGAAINCPTGGGECDPETECCPGEEDCCPLNDPTCDSHCLESSIKSSELVDDADGNGEIGPGDRVKFTIEAKNGCEGAVPGASVIDRVPDEITVDLSTVAVDGETVEGAALEACPEGATFEDCESEASSQCLIVDIGDVEQDVPVKVTFEATIDPEAVVDCDGFVEGQTCNTAIIGNDVARVERSTLVDLGRAGGGEDCPGESPPAGISGDLLATTGSGGCAVSPNGAAGGRESWPALLLMALLALRRVRRKGSR